MFVKNRRLKVDNDHPVNVIAQNYFKPDKSGELIVKIFVYPGSFDPFTNGHLDIVNRSVNLCDKFIISIATNSAKRSLFTVDERLDLINKSVANFPGVEVVAFDGLLVEFAEKVNATAIVRGIRAVTDFDYEYAMYQLNSDMSPEIESVFLLASKEYSFLSSTMIKEVARYGRVSKDHAPEIVNQALLKKFGHLV